MSPGASPRQLRVMGHTPSLCSPVSPLLFAGHCVQQTGRLTLALTCCRQRKRRRSGRWRQSGAAPSASFARCCAALTRWIMSAWYNGSTIDTRSEPRRPWLTIRIDTFVKPCGMQKTTDGRSESLAHVPTPGVSSSAPLAIASAGWPFIPHRGIRKTTRAIFDARWTGALVPNRRPGR